MRVRLYERVDIVSCGYAFGRALKGRFLDHVGEDDVFAPAPGELRGGDRDRCTGR